MIRTVTGIFGIMNRTFKNGHSNIMRNVLVYPESIIRGKDVTGSMSSDQNLPSVTIAIPAYNEEEYIEGIIEKFQKASYSNIIEILVADGRSTDRTAEIVRRLSQDDPRVKLVDNPDRIQSAGLNRLISVARGDLFLRADAHCDYAEDYVAASVNASMDSGALNVGGSQRFVATNRFQSYIALAVSSVLGSGGARYRDEFYEGYADTVFLGCYRTDVIKRLHGFSTGNVTNQDAELNIRLEKEQKDAVYISPDIRVWYYPRKDFPSLFRQYFKYGKGRCLTFFKHSAGASLRGGTPFLTITILFLIAVYLMASGYFLALALFIASVLFIVLASVAGAVYKNRERFHSTIWKGESDKVPGWISRVLGTTFVVLTMNFAHFAGFGWQILRFLAGKKSW